MDYRPIVNDLAITIKHLSLDRESLKEMNINKILVLDAMGVIYQSCDDVEELLVPFIREQGSNIDKKTIEDLYTRASLG